MDIEGYRDCGCGAKVLEHVAWQTGGRCFECFLRNDMVRFHEVEVIQRSTVHKVKLPKANIPAHRRPDRKAKPNSGTRNVVDADLARLRACRRMRWLFPDVFDILYAEERHKAGLDPHPHREPDHLVRAVETYTAFAAYHAASDRSE